MQKHTDFETFIEAYGRAGFNLIRKMLYRKPDAIDDVYQHALLLAYEHWDAVRSEASRRPWFMQIAANAAREEIRSWGFVCRKNEQYFGSTLDVIDAGVDMPHGSEAESIRALDMDRAIYNLRRIIRKLNNSDCIDAVLSSTGRYNHMNFKTIAIKNRYWRWREKVKKELRRNGLTRECFTLDH